MGFRGSRVQIPPSRLLTNSQTDWGRRGGWRRAAPHSTRRVRWKPERGQAKGPGDQPGALASRATLTLRVGIPEVVKRGPLPRQEGERAIAETERARGPAGG